MAIAYCKSPSMEKVCLMLRKLTTTEYRKFSNKLCKGLYNNVFLIVDCVR